MYGMLWKVWKVVLCFHNIPYKKRNNLLIYRGMEVWKIFSRFWFQNLIKKIMYSKGEIKIIINNCKNLEELYTACSCIRFLVNNGYQKRSSFLQTLALSRFRELEN